MSAKPAEFQREDRLEFGLLPKIERGKVPPAELKEAPESLKQTEKSFFPRRGQAASPAKAYPAD